MKNLLPLLLVAALAAESRAFEVTVEREGAELIIQATPPLEGEKYSVATLTVGEMEYKTTQTSATSWRALCPMDSGKVSVVVCGDGYCRLEEAYWGVPNRLPLLAATALLCGFIMNLMPCVLPVLGLKLRAFGKQRWPYVAGVLLAFSLLATCSVALGTGLSLMGFQHYRSVMTVVCLLMAAQLFGLWRVPSFGASGNVGPFGMGLLSVALGSSCAVPFLAPVMAYTVSCSAFETYLLFMLMGVGFSSPFLIPNFKMPEFFRHYQSKIDLVFGYIMLGISGVFAYTLDSQNLSMVLLASGGALGILCLYDKPLTKFKFSMCVFFCCCLLFSVVKSVGIDEKIVDITGREIPESGPRLIMVTADWCLTCQVVKHTLDDPRVVERCEELGIEKIIIKYNNINTSKFLIRHTGAADVPVLLIEGVGGNVTILTGVWTVSDILNALL